MDIYLWIVDGGVKYHASLAAAARIDGLTRAPDKTVTEAQWEAADGIARVINGGIFLGKAPEEVAEERRQAQAAEYHALLDQVDRGVGMGRAARGLLIRLANADGIGGECGVCESCAECTMCATGAKSDDYRRIKQAENTAEPLRAELRGLNPPATPVP